MAKLCQIFFAKKKNKKNHKSSTSVITTIRHQLIRHPQPSLHICAITGATPTADPRTHIHSKVLRVPHRTSIYFSFTLFRLLLTKTKRRLQLLEKIRFMKIDPLRRLSIEGILLPKRTFGFSTQIVTRKWTCGMTRSLTDSPRQLTDPRSVWMCASNVSEMLRVQLK